MNRYLRLLFQLILAPRQGWADVAREDADARSLLKAGFLPLLGVMALSVFLQEVYHPTLSMAYLLQHALVEFAQYFLTMFLAQGILGEFAFRFLSGEPTEQRNSTFVMLSLSLMALAQLVENCIPIEMPVVEFMAIYTAIVMWRGCPYMRVDQEKTGQFMGLAIGCTILPVFVISFLFGLILPSQY